MQKFQDIRDATVEMSIDQNIYILGGGMARFVSYFGVRLSGVLLTFVMLMRGVRCVGQSAVCGELRSRVLGD